MKIKYLAHYNTTDNEEKRAFFAPAATKISYVASSMEKAGYEVEIISASNTFAKRNSPCKRKKISDRISLVLLPGFGRGDFLKNKLSTALFHMHLFLYLLSDLKREDTLVVYHSLALIPLIRVLKKWKKFRLVLEVEEIYGNVTEDAATVAREMEYFQLADAYIFITELLNRKVNAGHKPYALAHGTYRVENERNTRFPEWDAQKIHCLYAGTFNPKKGGAIAAVNAAAYLPEGYHLHILGSGNSRDMQRIKDLANLITAQGKCTVTYDGFLSGEDYIRFVQACDIGLSTQNPNAAFNATSFPSKILSYMANGLRVVSVRIPAVEQSDVGDLVYYYDEQNPEQIAETILQVDLKDSYSGTDRIRVLDQGFVDAMKKILEQ